MIRFKYRIGPELAPLIQETIIDYYDEYLYGLLEEWLVYDLRSCGLFVVCEDNTSSGQQVNLNPVAIVARNTIEAMEIYTNEYKKYGYIVGQIEDRCDTIKVEAV